MLMCAVFNLRPGETGVFEIFLWLLFLLVACGVALWPSTGRDQRAELALERLSWADRVEFGEPTEGGRSAAPLRGMPRSAPTSRVG